MSKIYFPVKLDQHCLNQSPNLHVRIIQSRLLHLYDGLSTAATYKSLYRLIN